MLDLFEKADCYLRDLESLELFGVNLCAESMPHSYYFIDLAVQLFYSSRSPLIVNFAPYLVVVKTALFA